jgi:hypothetical protein
VTQINEAPADIELGPQYKHTGLVQRVVKTLPPPSTHAICAMVHFVSCTW